MIGYKIKSLLYVLKLILRKKKRTSNYVKNEYDYSWLDSKKPKNMYYQGFPIEPYDLAICKVNNKLVKMTYGDMALTRRSKHFTIVKNLVNEQDVIVELGCGTGGNLFFFSDNGLKNKMIGYDQSPHAIDYCNTHKYENMSFFVADIIKDEIDLMGKVVITSLSLEQVKAHMDKIIKRIINIHPKLVINFETIFEYVDFISKLYIKGNDYQDNLLKTLKENNVEILQCYDLGFSANPLRPVFCLIWKPK